MKVGGGGADVEGYELEVDDELIVRLGTNNEGKIVLIRSKMHETVVCNILTNKLRILGLVKQFLLTLENAEWYFGYWATVGILTQTVHFTNLQERVIAVPMFRCIIKL